MLEENKLDIVIQSNMKTVNYLDVTLNLENSTYRIYQKESNQIRYGPPSLLRNINCKLLETVYSSLTQTLLYGNPSFNVITNLLILNVTLDFILSTKRFEEALFYNQPFFLFVS